MANHKCRDLQDETVIMFAMAATRVAVIVNTEQYNVFMKVETTQDLGSLEWHFMSKCSQISIIFFGCYHEQIGHHVHKNINIRTFS